MISRRKAASFGASAIVAIGASALAQSPPEPSAGQSPAPGAGQVPLYDPRQLPAQRGQVQQFTLTPRGDIDGLILTDGTEVKTPPHLSTEIAYSIRLGDAVIIHGLRAAALPLVQAASITDEATGRTVVDNGPPGSRRDPGGPSAPSPASPVAELAPPIPGLAVVQGRVRMRLHGPQGDVNGALLNDGTVLRLPPPEAYRFAALLLPGQAVVAAGTEVATVLGKVLEVQQIGASREQLSLVETPPRPGPARRPSPPPDPGLGPPIPPRP